MTVSPVKALSCLLFAGVLLTGNGRAKAQQSLYPSSPQSGPMTLQPAGKAAPSTGNGDADDGYARPADLKAAEKETVPEPFNTSVEALGATDGVAPAITPEEPQPAIIPVSVEVDSLDALTGDSAGVLKEDKGGFGVNMWEGTDRAFVDYLLPKMPVTTTSASVRNLMRRLLLSVAHAPKGAGKAGELVASRARLLAAMGDLEGVKSLMDATPNRQNIQGLLKVEADVRLLTGDNARACQIAANELDRADSPYWSKTMIFCQIMGGQQDAAVLGMDLLREVGEDDPTFFTLAGSLLGHSQKKLDRMPNPTSLHLAMVQAVKVPLPEDALTTASPGMLRAIANTPTADEELRLEAAEKAESAGALDLVSLRKVYQSVKFDKDVLKNPLSEAEKLSGPRAQALLYQTTDKSDLAAVRAEAIARALDMGFEAGRYAQTARVFQPLMTRVPAEKDFAWLAPSAARALLIAGDREGARPWVELLKSKFRVSDNATKDERSLLVLASLAGLDEGFGTESILPNWIAALGDDQTARVKISLVYSLFDGLGYQMPMKAWDALLAGPLRENANVPHAALVYRYAKALEEQKIGEVVLLTTIMLGDEGPAGADPVLLDRLLEGLVSVGLDQDARALAVEAAAANGI